MFNRFKHRKRAPENLKMEDIAAVSRLLIRPQMAEQTRVAIQAKNTILQEDVAMDRSIASGAGTSGGFGAFQPFLSAHEIEDRTHPNAWEHLEAPETDAPQRVDRGEMEDFFVAYERRRRWFHRYKKAN